MESNTNEIRPLTNDEIAQFEKALGGPIDPTYLVDVAGD
jgi:hypothetical protein